MNTWTKALAAGAAATALIFLLSETILKKKEVVNRSQLYKASYVVKPDQELSPAMLQKITAIIKNRFTNADYPCTIVPGHAGALRIEVTGIDDTILVDRIITGRGQLEFREVYTLEDIGAGIASADPVISEKYLERTGTKNSRSPAPPATPDTLETVDTLSLQELPFTPGIVEEAPPASIRSLISFAEAVRDESGLLRYPAYIGMARREDTGLVGTILRDPEWLQRMPADIRFYFGSPITAGDQKKKIHELYAIRTRNRPADLVNKDVVDARADFSMNGSPEITMKFKPAASRRWARMTTANIGRPIAIIFDDVVISAPNVLNAIEGGVSSISGSFTLSEVRVLAAQISGEQLPAALTITDRQIIAQKTWIGTRYSLFILIVFTVMTLLAFFIFKALKNR